MKEQPDGTKKPRQLWEVVDELCGRVAALEARPSAHLIFNATGNLQSGNIPWELRVPKREGADYGPLEFTPVAPLESAAREPQQAPAAKPIYEVRRCGGESGPLWGVFNTLSGVRIDGPYSNEFKADKQCSRLNATTPPCPSLAATNAVAESRMKDSIIESLCWKLADARFENEALDKGCVEYKERAEKAERERDEAKSGAAQIFGACKTARRECDEWKVKAASWERQLNDYIVAAGECQRETESQRDAMVDKMRDADAARERAVDEAVAERDEHLRLGIRTILCESPMRAALLAHFGWKEPA